MRERRTRDQFAHIAFYGTVSCGKEIRKRFLILFKRTLGRRISPLRKRERFKQTPLRTCEMALRLRVLSEGSRYCRVFNELLKGVQGRAGQCAGRNRSILRRPRINKSECSAPLYEAEIGSFCNKRF